jgi:hypothetical protein
LPREARVAVAKTSTHGWGKEEQNQITYIQTQASAKKQAHRTPLKSPVTNWSRDQLKFEITKIPSASTRITAL